jgi:glucan phosphoethanolaminetransferase (alkaline phosphatase superfamily)
MFSIFLRGYGLKEEYIKFKIPIYLLYFLIVPLLTITFISIFKESRKVFIYLNTSLFLMIVFHSIFFYVQRQGNRPPTVYSFILMNILFVVGPTLLINYFRHIPVKNEIEEIGQHKE